MSIVRKTVATTAAAATLGIGVGAYKAHESAGEIKSEAASVNAIYHEPATAAELKGIAHTRDLQAIFLLGSTVLLGVGTAAGYGASRNKPAKSRDS